MAIYRLIFKVEPMHCKNCVGAIRQGMSDFDSGMSGVKLQRCDISLRDKTVTLDLETAVNQERTVQDMLTWMKKKFPRRNIRFEGVASIRVEGVAAEQEFVPEPIVQKSDLRHYWGASRTLLLAGIWLFLSLTGLSLPGLWYSGFMAFSTLLLIWDAWPFVRSAWAQWFENTRMNMDSLFVLSGAMIILVSWASLFSPIFSCTLESGFLIFGFRHLGCVILEILDRKIGINTSLVQRYQSQIYQEVDADGKFSAYKTALNFQVGDYLYCQAGDVVPVDGRVHWMADGSSVMDSISQGALFSDGVERQDSTLLAGSQIVTGAVIVVVTQPLLNSRLENIDSLVDGFQKNPHKAKILQQSERWLQWLIPGILMIALLSGIGIAQVYSLAMAVQCVTSILVSVCPCTLGLIIPMAMRMGAYKASREHIVFKSSQALQLAAQAQVFVMDLNGTLTQGEPKVANVEVFKFETGQVFSVLYQMETLMLQERPGQLIGLAIQKYAHHRLVRDAAPMIEGELGWCSGGAWLQINSERWWLGNAQVLAELELVHFANETVHQYYLLYQNHADASIELVARFQVQDQLRAESQQLIAELQAQGKMIKVCTGAERGSVVDMLQTLNIAPKNVAAGRSYAAKSEYIQELRVQYPEQVFAMIGDAVNDKVAMEACDLKILVKHGKLDSLAQHSMEDAVDLELSAEHIGALTQVSQIAQQTMTLIYQNLGFSLLYNFSVLGISCGALLTFGWILYPVVGVCLMILQSAVLILNTYRVFLKSVPTATGSENLEINHELQYAHG